MALDDFNLDGTVALVTGAGRGIGAGVAAALAEAGAAVAVNALTGQFVEPLAERIAAHTDAPVRSYAGDMTDPASVEAVVARVLADYGRIDVLVNAVGDAIPGPLVPLPERSRADAAAIGDEELRRILDLNLTAAILGSRAVGPHMLQRRSWSVINIGSAAGFRGGAGVALYTAAKAGITGLTRALALEWAPYGVRVNAIAPGSFPDVLTQGEEGVRAMEERAVRSVPLARTGQTREVGLLAVYLASRASAYMAGQTLYLDGGATL